MPKRTKLVLLTVGIVLLGFLRDYLFYNINWIYMTLTVDRPNQALDEFHFLLNWAPGEIILLKWILTILFTIVFFGLTWYIINLTFKNRSFNRITVLTFAALIFFSAILYVFDYMFGPSDQIYGVIRTFMGFAQSFIPLMILYLLFRFLPGANQTHS